MHRKAGCSSNWLQQAAVIHWISMFARDHVKVSFLWWINFNVCSNVRRYSSSNYRRLAALGLFIAPTDHLHPCLLYLLNLILVGIFSISETLIKGRVFHKHTGAITITMSGTYWSMASGSMDPELTWKSNFVVADSRSQKIKI